MKCDVVSVCIPRAFWNCVECVSIYFIHQFNISISAATVAAAAALRTARIARTVSPVTGTRTEEKGQALESWPDICVFARIRRLVRRDLCEISLISLPCCCGQVVVACGSLADIGDSPLARRGWFLNLLKLLQSILR